MLHEGACKKVFCEVHFEYSLLLCPEELKFAKQEELKG